MVLRRTQVFAAAVMFAAGSALSNAADNKPIKTTEEQQAGWNDSQMQQSTTESIDLNAYNAIREEGLQTLARDGLCRRTRRRNRPSANRLAQHGEGQRVDARPTYQDGLRQRASGGLG